MVNFSHYMASCNIHMHFLQYSHDSVICESGRQLSRRKTSRPRASWRAPSAARTSSEAASPTAATLLTYSAAFVAVMWVRAEPAASISLQQAIKQVWCSPMFQSSQPLSNGWPCATLLWDRMVWVLPSSSLPRQVKLREKLIKSRNPVRDCMNPLTFCILCCAAQPRNLYQLALRTSSSAMSDRHTFIVIYRDRLKFIKKIYI